MTKSRKTAKNPRGTWLYCCHRCAYTSTAVATIERHVTEAHPPHVGGGYRLAPGPALTTKNTPKKENTR